MSNKKSTKTTPVSSVPPVSSLLASSTFTPLVPVGTDVTFDTILSALRAATPEQLAEYLQVCYGGYDIWAAKYGSVDTPVKPAKVPKTKAEPKPKKEKPVPAPLPDDGSVPSAAAYRLNSADIDHSICIGRVFSDEDKRWKPSVLREAQCGKSVVDGSDICTRCTKRSEKAAESGKGDKCGWNGRVTEEPPSWCHMLGTAWADKCKWIPDGASVSDSASVASEHSSTADKMNAAAAKKEAAADKKAAAKKAKTAKPKKDPVAVVSTSNAVADTNAPTTTAAKKAKSAKPKKDPVAVVSTSNAVADTNAPTTTADGILDLIGHSLYWNRGGNIYEYDEESSVVGSFVGRKNPDGSIDEDADEVFESESDSE